MVKDYQILKETINSTIFGSGLDVGVVYFIFKDIFRELENMYYAQINNELRKESEQKQNQNNKETETEVI